MLTLQTLKELQDKQKELDEFIVKSKKLTDTDSKKSFVRTKIALLVEIGELANELKTFKHWKSQKDINWEKVKEELIDCLHFYLSWANSFEIDFSDYKFQKLVPEPDFNELLLAFFLETGSFSISVPWSILKPKMLVLQEKIWEEQISKLKPEDKNYKKNVEGLRKVKEETLKDTKKIGSSFLSEIEVEKNKSSFYRWLIIFEELAQKMGMKSEEDIKKAYLNKNEENWKRQQKNY